MLEDIKRPRFLYRLESIEGHRIHSMPIENWNSIQSDYGVPIKINVEDTPMSNITRDATVIAAVATRHIDKPAEIDIYREDEKDELPINKDTYIVLENIPARADYHKIIEEVSTCDNNSLRDYLNRSVFLVKKDNTEDHWLPDLPSQVSIVIEHST